MRSSLEELLKAYKPKDLATSKLALRELIQSLLLVGLSKAGFFEKASFYGGTALRIFYGLKRFSEDLDFTLNEPDETFDLASYIQTIEETASAYGIDLKVEKKDKVVATPVESAFAKCNTYTALLYLKATTAQGGGLHKDEVTKVKFEVDTKPAIGFKTEAKWLDSPEFAPVMVLDEPSLFAGKLHALLCRNYKNNVKGRDYYDFLFYMSRHVSPNLDYLHSKLVDTGKLKQDDPFDLSLLKKMLKDRFETVDIRKALEDAEKFLMEPEDLSKYDKDLFLALTERLC